MSIFKFLRSFLAAKKKDENDPTYRKYFAERLNKKLIRYVSERTESTDGEIVDTIIGKDGMLYINSDGDFVVICKNEDIFKAKISALKANELMSLEGVILESYDYIEKKERKIIAYYKYYR